MPQKTGMFKLNKTTLPNPIFSSLRRQIFNIYFSDSSLINLTKYLKAPNQQQSFTQACTVSQKDPLLLPSDRLADFGLLLFSPNAVSTGQMQLRSATAGCEGDWLYIDRCQYGTNPSTELYAPIRVPVSSQACSAADLLVKSSKYMVQFQLHLLKKKKKKKMHTHLTR